MQDCLKHIEDGNSLKIFINQYINTLNKLIIKYRHINLLFDNKSEYIIGPEDISSRDYLTLLEFKAALEYEFWRELENSIPKLLPDLKRKYSYDKVYKRHVKGKLERRYGLVYQIDNIDYVRICIDNTESILISKGYFDDKNIWSEVKFIEKYEIKNFKTIDDVSNLTKKIREIEEVSMLRSPSFSSASPDFSGRG